MEVKRTETTVVQVYRPDLIAMLKLMNPDNLAIRSLPADGKAVGVELSGTMVVLTHTSAR